MKSISAIEPLLNDKDKAYAIWARPLAAELLKGVELDITYKDGQGHWLKASIDNHDKLILDMVGGYGANLLGHKPSFLIQEAHRAIDQSLPSTQASIRQEAGVLAKKISSLLENETNEGPWITTFSNSGTEAVEAALKHALLSYKYKQDERILDYQKLLNESLREISCLENTKQKEIYFQFKKNIIVLTDKLKISEDTKHWFINLIEQSQNISDLLHSILIFNKKQLKSRPYMVSIEKGYHGKTMGALSLTYNQHYRESFYLNDENQHTIFIKPSLDHEQLTEEFNKLNYEIIDWEFSDNQFFLKTYSLSKVAGLILEPIQGEAGVFELPHGFLTLLKKFSLQFGFQLIFDEIQCGLYRTGTFSAATHANVTADIYCFSKALGGGMAKIGATVINKKKYLNDFGLLHTSTFSEDSFSSLIATAVLEFFENKTQALKVAMEAGENLKSQLQDLQMEFPQFIKEIRGKGLMLAVELNEELSEGIFEYKLIQESKMLGFFFASYFLYEHSIRIAPTLSNPQTLRLQPSIYLNDHDIQKIVFAFKSLCRELENNNLSKIFKALYPKHELIKNEATLFSPLQRRKDKPLAVFLCHVIDGNHAQENSKTLKNVPTHEIEERLKYLISPCEFGIIHGQSFKNQNGEEIDIALMGLPITSEHLKKQFLSKNRSLLIKKVQNAVDYAKELGATVVGLGQFTSIVTSNGLYLDSSNISLTTGNSFTVSMAIDAALKACELKNINLNHSTVAIIGAAGNIMSTATSIMADHVQKIILVHHTEVEKSNKFMEAIRFIIKNAIVNSKSSLFKDKLLMHLDEDIFTNNKKLIQWLNDDIVREFFEVTSDLSKIIQADLVLTGASAQKGFLDYTYFKNRAVVVDIAVPANITTEQLEELKIFKPEVTYILGGIAKMPLEQHLNARFFPLPLGESFACLAETISLGFYPHEKHLNIGQLDKQMVLEVEKLAKNTGFSLASFKIKNSI